MVKVEFGSFNPEPHGTPMTKINMDLTELLQKQDQGDFLRTIAEAVLQLIMEADVDGLMPHRRSLVRTKRRMANPKPLHAGRGVRANR